MVRTLLVLFLLASLWPSSATAELRVAGALEWGSCIERLAPTAPAGALPGLGGWELLPRPDAERDSRQGRGRTPGDTGGSLRPDAAPVLRVAGSGGDDALLDAGVLLIRYEHLPYFATAPPSSR